MGGDAAGAAALLAAGADPNVYDRVAGWTPLHWATHHGHAACVAALLAHRGDGADDGDGKGGRGADGDGAPAAGDAASAAASSWAAALLRRGCRPWLR